MAHLRILNSAFWVHYSIIMYGDGIFNQFWMSPPTYMTYMERKNDMILCVHNLTQWNWTSHNTLDVVHQNNFKLCQQWIYSNPVQILCFCDECVQCHLEDCNFSFSSWVLAYAVLIAIIQFSVLSLRRKTVSEQYMSCDGPTAAPHLLCRWCSTHLAAILHIFKFCHNVQSITNP